MAYIDSREVKCEQDILTAIIDASGLSPQGTDGILHKLDVRRMYGEVCLDLFSLKEKA